jgi:hypothetical protein
MAKTQTLSFPIRLSDAIQAEALRLLDASRLAHGSRQERCEMESAGRLLRAQASRKQVFETILPLLSEGLIKPATDKRPAGKDSRQIKEQVRVLRAQIAESGEDVESFTAMTNLIEQACNGYLHSEAFPSARELAHLASNLLILLALLYDCQLVCGENLTTLKSEGRGRGVGGRFRNWRTNTTVRGELWRVLKYKCHLLGIRARQVEPPGTTHTCPRCHTPAKTYASPAASDRSKAVDWGAFLCCDNPTCLWRGKLGFPKMKKKSKAIGSFRLTGSIKVFSDTVQLPRLGRLRLHEHDFIPTDAKVLSATVSEQAGRWFVSIQVEEEQEKPPPTATTAIGVDLGIKTLASCSDGKSFAHPRALKHAQKKLRRLERQKSRRKKGGKNRKKTCRQLAKQHARVANIRLRTTGSFSESHAYGESSSGLVSGSGETALVEIGTNLHLGMS